MCIRDRSREDGMSLDPVSLQVMIGGLRAACDEMGATLIRSAYSANIKERHDCSTALFDARGELAMQAEHIPVHLGSMPDAVAAVLGEEHRPGDAWILNDPYRGGTHLPDVTLISPACAPRRRPTGSASCGWASWPSATASVGCAPGWRRSSPTPSGAPGSPWRSCRMAPTAPKTCSRTTPAASPTTSPYGCRRRFAATA